MQQAMFCIKKRFKDPCAKCLEKSFHRHDCIQPDERHYINKVYRKNISTTEILS